MRVDKTEPRPPLRLRKDPALVLCVRLRKFLQQQEQACANYSVKEQAMLRATPAEKAKAKRDLRAAHRITVRWDNKISAHLHLIFAHRANSIEGAAAKVRVILDYGAPSEEAADFPWPFLRSVCLDLERFAAMQAKLRTSLARHEHGPELAPDR
jgi:hypothetical protein